MRTTAAAVVTCLVANATLAFAQTSYFTDPNSGVEFSRIGSVNNAAYSGQAPFNLSPVGRGSVGYEYSIGRFEVTTAQWVEFYNAVYARADAISFPAQTLWTPTIWGGRCAILRIQGRGRGIVSIRMSRMLRCCRWVAFRGARRRYIAIGCIITSQVMRVRF